jgi:hypothetical protein
MSSCRGTPGREACWTGWSLIGSARHRVSQPVFYLGQLGIYPGCPPWPGPTDARHVRRQGEGGGRDPTTAGPGVDPRSPRAARCPGGHRRRARGPPGVGQRRGHIGIGRVRQGRGGQTRLPERPRRPSPRPERNPARTSPPAGDAGLAIRAQGRARTVASTTPRSAPRPGLGCRTPGWGGTQRRPQPTSRWRAPGAVDENRFKHFRELCVLFALQGSLRSGEIWV